MGPFVKLEPWTFPKASGERFQIKNCLGWKLGFLGSSYEKDCYLGAALESKTTGPQTTNFLHLLIQQITKQQHFLRQNMGELLLSENFKMFRLLMEIKVSSSCLIQDFAQKKRHMHFDLSCWWPRSFPGRHHLLSCWSFSARKIRVVWFCLFIPTHTASSSWSHSKIFPGSRLKKTWSFLDDDKPLRNKNGG